MREASLEAELVEGAHLGAQAAHEEDAVLLGELQREVAVGEGHEPDLFARIVDALDGPDEPFGHRRELSLAHRLDQVVLRREVKVDRGRGAVDGLRHLADGERVAVAGLEDEGLGRVEDLVAESVALAPAGPMRSALGRW